MGIGLAGAVVGTAVLWLLLRAVGLGEALGTSAQLAVVIGVAAGCDIFRDDAGLIAAIIMGVAVANIAAFGVPARRPFFETLVQLVIGLLFVSIAATITPASLHHLVLPTLGLAAVLVLVVRPVVTAVATLRTDLSRGERIFTGWMAPRGIVAAATATTTFSATSAAHNIVGASKILPVTFLVIVVTVAVYGLSAAPVARLVGVLNPPRTRPLLVGGDPWVVQLGGALRSAGLDVLMRAGHEQERARIRQANLELAPGELLASAAGSGAQLEGVTAVLLLTDEDDFNALASTLLEAGGDHRSTGSGPSPAITALSRRSPDRTSFSVATSPGPRCRLGMQEAQASLRARRTGAFPMDSTCCSWSVPTAPSSRRLTPRGRRRTRARRL